MKKISNSEWAKIFGIDLEEENNEEFLKAVENIPGSVKVNKENTKCITKSLKIKLPKKSTLNVDSSIDLHLKTKQESKTLLKSFFYDSVKSKDKYILIIHGKGKHSKGQGILKSYVKQLLESEFRNVIDWYSEAPKQLGGEGAVIVKIRRTNG